MPNLPHLMLPKANYNLPRKKTGHGKNRKIDYKKHGNNLKNQINTTLEEFKAKVRPQDIDPSLILRIQLHSDSVIDEKAWARNDLHLLSIDEYKSLVLFSTDVELRSFLNRLGQYKNGPPIGQKNTPHASLFSEIHSVGSISPEDRIGRIMRLENISNPSDFDQERSYTLDIELWPIEQREHRETQIRQITLYIEKNRGEVLDTYPGIHLIIMRVKCLGKHVQELLDIESIVSIDFPPTTDLVVEELLEQSIEKFVDTSNPPDNSSALAIFDTGITSAHPFLAPAIGEATAFPDDLGDGGDIHGHGTKVAGIALYNDIRQCAIEGKFEPKLRLYSAKVVDDNGCFSDKKLIMTQMTDAIKYFNNTYNCRVFNISLGDRRLVYDGGKIGGWATVLDALSRELDIVIVVPTGNFKYQINASSSPDSILKDYPTYFLQEDARIYEPATGALVVTVGSICESDRILSPNKYEADIQPIANRNEPSPFTRRGPGCGGAIKPEFCDYGGNIGFNGVEQKIDRSKASLSILSLNNNYLKNLLTTSIGTSFAAPRVAHKAAMLFNSFPNASSNLIRSFLAISSTIPEGSTERLLSNSEQEPLNLIGYGQPALEKANFSDENRVVMFSEEQLNYDNFHIYEIPIVNDFIQTNGERSISVSLAFDPPVRHSRIDYIGVKMSFRLIRGKSLDIVAETFRKRTKDEKTVDSFSNTKYNCNMTPGPNKREGGTLQKASFTMKNNPIHDYGNTYFLVVICEKKWAPENEAPQTYSVVVQVEHAANINLHAQIRYRIKPPVRVRV